MTSITVVIPTYNAARFIRATLDSVFAQTLLPDELIVCDDCSPDETVAIVERIAGGAPIPVRVIRSSANSGGPAAPLNTGIEAARGESIAVLDHDDRMIPDRLFVQSEALAACPTAGLVLGRIRPDPSPHSVRAAAAAYSWKTLVGLPNRELAPGVHLVAAFDAWRDIFLHGSYAATCSLFLFPKRCWAAAGGFDPSNRTACDFAFFEKLARLFDIAYVDSEIIEWHDRIQTLTSASTRSRQTDDGLRVILGMEATASLRNCRIEWRQCVRSQLFDTGYDFRRDGLFRLALQAHLRSIRRTGPDRKTLSAILKLCAGRFLSTVGIK